MADVNPLDALDEAPSAAPAAPVSALADSPAPAPAQNPLDALDEDAGPDPVANYQRNKAYAKGDSQDYRTKLSPQDEQRFQQWVKDNHVPNDDSPTSDYDMRGFWRGVQTGDSHAETAVNPNDHQLHFSDWWKTPYHQSFSADSQWATKDAPKWNDKDQLVTPDGRVVFDERARAGGNPLDALDSGSAADATAGRMHDITSQAQIPEVTVSARKGPEASWSDVAAGVPTTIGAGIESKVGGAQEFIGHTAYDDARKKYWQATVLPDAVRDAQQQGISLTDVPEVQDAAKHLGIRVDTFTRDWPTYANQSPQELTDFTAAQRDRIQTGAQQIASGSKKRLTAQQVQESYAPNMDQHSLKALVFDAATMAPDILAGVGGTVATGGAGGAAIMAADIAPAEYSAARNRGLNHNDASTYAVLSTLASSVPEVPVLKIVENTPLASKIIGGVVGDKLADTAVGKVAGTAAAQGVTQSVVGALQQGIDAGVLNEHLPLNEALKQVAWSGLTGAVVGAPMGAFHAATSRKPPGETAPGSSPVEAPAAAGGLSSEPEGGPSQEVNSSGRANPEGKPQEPSVAPPSVDTSPTGIDATEGEIGAKGSNISPEHAALQAMKDQTITPPQADALEKAGLIKRNDLNEPVWLPAGRRRLVELDATGEARPDSAESGKEPGNNPVITPRIRSDEDLRAGLEGMKNETGWAQEGGSVLRDATSDQVVGRTSWIPNAEWWPDRPKGLTEPQVHAAVDKALAGEPLKPAEQKMVDFMTQVHDERTAMNQSYEDLKSAVPEVEQQPKDAIDLTMLASRAGEHDPAATSATIDTWNDDKPETLTRVRGELESIIARGQQTENAREVEPAAAAAAPSQEKASQEGVTFQTAKGSTYTLDEQGRTTRDKAARPEHPGDSGPQPKSEATYYVSPADAQKLGEFQTRGGPRRTLQQVDSGRIGIRYEEGPSQGKFERRTVVGVQGEPAPGLIPVETWKGGARAHFGNEITHVSPSPARFQVELERARAETHSEPTDSQKAAGNYRKGRLDFGGMEVAIENPKGSTRSGVSADGTPWSRELAHDYGYFTGTKGADGDAVDTFLTGKPDTGKMFAVNQIHPDSGKFDEVKAIAGADTAREAEQVYRANYPRGWKGLGSLAEMATSKFKDWLRSGDTKKPVPGGERVERRSGSEMRTRVAHMTPEQLRAALLTHELTGIPNRRAYTEAEHLPHQVSIDVDSLKWVNDNMGHESGNALLKGIASSLSSHSDNVFHLSGDEFAAQAHTETEAHELMRNVSEHLKNATMEVEMPDGRVVKLKGMGVSYGVGKTLEEADAALQSHKTRREAEGTRAGRGQAPPGATVGAREEGRQDQTGGAAEGVEPKARRSAGSGTGLPRADVERIVHNTVRDAGLAGFPHVEVHEDTSTLPERIQDVIRQAGAEGTTGAVYDPVTGRTHLIASNNGSEREVRENLWHEAVGHHGLRMAMARPEYNAIMDGIARDMPDRVQAAANRNHLDPSDPEQKRAAAEEVIAYAAGQHLSGQPIDKPVLPWFNRAVRAVRGFFGRMTGKPFYDDRAIDGLIQRARQALEHGNPLDEPGQPRLATRAPPFYSPVERAVTESKQGKASADQWLATIKKAAGIKPEELEWLNLEPWLKSHSGPIRKEEISDYVRANKLELEESLHGASADGEDTEDQKLQTRLAESLRAEGHDVSFDEAGNLDSIGVRTGNEPDGNNWDTFSMHDPQEVAALPASLRDRVRQLDEVSQRVSGTMASAGDEAREPARYEEYTLPGGQNYRELLLRLPHRESPKVPYEALTELPEHFQVTRDQTLHRRRQYSVFDARGGATGPIFGSHPTEEEARAGALVQLNGERRQRALEEAKRTTLNYQSSHFYEPNIVAHTRFKERTDPDGRRVLHLEEVQSDWHQAGRARGYRSDLTPEQQSRLNEIDAHIERLAANGTDEEDRQRYFKPGDLIRGYGGSVDKVLAYHPEVAGGDGRQFRYWSVEVIGVNRDGTPKYGEMPRSHSTDPAPEIQHDLAAERRAIDSERRVPDAPFKTSWPMLAMKRMIRWAAENGFDRLSWVTGDQQNERYSLEHQVDWVRAERFLDPEGNRKYFLSARHPEGRELAGFGQAFHEDELPGVVGQELAAKIAAQPEGRNTYSGLDLKVGGSGMRGFYDDILPRETNKLIKKYGGKVDDTTVLAPSLDHTPAKMMETLGIENRDWLNLSDEEQADIYRRYKAQTDNYVPAHGFDITPEMKQAALGSGFPLFSRRQAELPLEENREKGPYAMVRSAVNAVAESAGVRDLRKLISPAGMSAESRQVARITAESLGKLAHETVQTQEALEQFSRLIDKTPIAEQLAMMDAIEKGEPQANPEMQPVADAMRKMLDTWRGKVQGLGEGYLDNFIENYFPHYWQRPGEAQRMVASIMGRRPLRGPASFLKMRTIPSIKEGMDAGLTPLTTNPLIMTLLKTREMQRFISGVTLMRRFKEDGLANFLPAGRPMPDGWAPINDNIAKVRSWSEAENGFIERGQYIMPIDAARVINNHVSASLLKDFAPAAIIRRGANALNAMQLGFSAFHLGFTTLDAMISKNAQGLERMLHGEVGKAVQSFAEGVTPVGAFTNVRRGYNLLHAYTDPAGATPDMQKLVDALQQAGGRAHMDRYYQAAEGVSPFRGVGIRSLANDVRTALTGPTDKLENLGRALGSFPVEYANKLMRGMQEIWKTTPAMEVPVEVAMRVVRASTSWIMEHLVPMQKLGVFSDLAADHLRRNPTEDPNDRAASMQRIWASVDNRLGEMVYDNLFWNRTMKDTLHLGIRAVGWNVGTVREIGGAPVDIVKAVDKLISKGRITADDLGHRIPYVMSMAATTALYAAVYQYMATGQGPQELKDYFFPRSGGVTTYGTPQRVSLPSYVKDVYEYTQRPGTTVVNKLNPIFSLIGNLYSNQDFFGNPITDPEAGYWTQKWQQLKFAGGEFTPFSLQGRQQMQATDAGTGFGAAVKQALPMIGVTPAPGYITSGEQMERRKRLEDDQKYTGELKYQIKKAILGGDKAKAQELTKEYVESVKRMNVTKMQVGQDKAKAAAARRKAATAMRQAGFPATADLVASLPLEPDAAARRYFATQTQEDAA